MAATLKRFVYKVRSEKGNTNFANASGNVGVLAFETEDRSMQMMFLISDTAVTPSDFNNWDDGEDLPLPTFLFDQTTGMLYILTATDTWTEVGEVT